MEKTLGKDIENEIQRKQFLTDNCDCVEKKGYMKQYSPAQMQSNKEELANVSIEISDIENEMNKVKASYKRRLKPLIEKRENMVFNIKQKAEYVSEDCYRFTDQNARMTGYYNADGDLIEERPATAEELQTNLFALNRGRIGEGNDAAKEAAGM